MRRLLREAVAEKHAKLQFNAEDEEIRTIIHSLRCGDFVEIQSNTSLMQREQTASPLTSVVIAAVLMTY